MAKKKAKRSVPKGCVRAFTIFDKKGEIAMSVGEGGEWLEGGLLSLKKQVTGDKPVAVVPLDGRFEIVVVKKPARRPRP